MESITHTSKRPSAAEALSLLNTDQTAQALGISRRTLQERVALGEIGCIRIGRCIRFQPEDIADFVSRNACRPVGWKGGRTA